MGSAWKNHKYLRIENGRYIYPGDEKSGRKQAQADYSTMREKMKALKRKQLEYENRIDDNSLGDKEKTKTTYDAGDRLDRVLRKMDKLNVKMKNQKTVYKNTFGNRLSADLKAQKQKQVTKTDPATEKKRLEARLLELQKKRSEYDSGLRKSTRTAKMYYSKSNRHKSNPKSDEYQVNGIIGKKYESAGRRYASKLNIADRKINNINKRLKQLGRDRVSALFK